jgi:SEC-C motif
MQTLRRNDPCPCGSGKKYKHCCLNKEGTQAVSDWCEAVSRAIKWLMAEHPSAVGEALDNQFFGSLDENEGKILHAHESWETALINALDWLLAEGTITVDGSERRVSELLLEGGPLFSAPERQYLERLAAAPLRLYEVAEVTPGRSMSLKDVLLPERLPVLVREKTGSKKVLQFDLIATRIVSMEDHFVLSDSVYLIPWRHGLVDRKIKEAPG